MAKKQMTEKLIPKLDQFLIYICDRMERVFLAVLGNENRTDATMLVLRNELWRFDPVESIEMLITYPCTPVEKFVHGFTNRAQGLTLTVVEAVVPTVQLQATKDITCRSVWQDVGWLEGELNKLLPGKDEPAKV